MQNNCVVVITRPVLHSDLYVQTNVPTLCFLSIRLYLNYIFTFSLYIFLVFFCQWIIIFTLLSLNILNLVKNLNYSLSSTYSLLVDGPDLFTLSEEQSI